MTTIKKFRKKYTSHNPRSTKKEPVTSSASLRVKTDKARVTLLKNPVHATLDLEGGVVTAEVLSESKDFVYSAPPYTGVMALTLVKVPGETESRLISSERVISADDSFKLNRLVTNG